MKYLARVLAAVCLTVTLFFAWGHDLSAMAAATSTAEEAAQLNDTDAKLAEQEQGKLDLNNDNIRKFRKFRGMFPTLAKIVIENTNPKKNPGGFERVEEVFDMPGLSERQKQILELNLDNFIVTPPIPAMWEGDERLNNGIYD